jgi:large subunit ribosomal protein L9
MQVILKEDVRHLGDVGDLVNVKPGHARNYLFPRGLAVYADPRQLNRINHERRLIEARVNQMRTLAEANAEKMKSLVIEVKKAAGEGDKLFGSVTSMELESLINDLGFEIERRQIQMENIKTLGESEVKIRLHRDVTIAIKVNVVRAEA